MNRLGALVWLLLVVLAGFATFKAKYAVQDLEDQLNRVRKQTIAEQQEIRVLNAEWTYLNQPERLAELNRRFLSLVPITAKQLQRSIEDIPMRPPPAPDMLVAAAPPVAAAPQTPPAARPVAAAPQTPPAARPVAAAPQARPAPLPVVAATLAPATPGAALPIRLATAGPGSLDALIAQIAEAR